MKLGDSMQVADIGGRRLHFALTGPQDGPALALVNSLGTDFRLWDAFLPYLAAGWRVLRWDFAGHGLSEPMDGACTIARHADDLAALMDAVGIGRAAVFGVSVGGQIGQQIAATRPDRVRGLIAADTAAKIGDATSWAARIAAVREQGLGGMADTILERWFPADWRAAHPADLALWRMMLTRQSADGYVATCEALRDADLTDQSARIACPTLVIAGLEDGSTPPDLVRGLARLIPGARLAEIAGAGHLPMADAPEAVAAAVNPFLASLPA
jgi:3-oxoadipate enol-lactonase